ncbi:hypothetical protein QQS21_005656 [Conoideocrella luteorostrata]|uniref:Major facilitator superfamily (MFS) profile domain-containing protein n=1 Tax=Conoideocrella luteorostrata TaxID=1105319 RepID=A0AAJ0CQ44_9HYPO|nr:hypothetical protein QQS21_005656 [Conoideocrella luteorostrata]
MRLPPRRYSVTIFCKDNGKKFLISVRYPSLPGIQTSCFEFQPSGEEHSDEPTQSVPRPSKTRAVHFLDPETATLGPILTGVEVRDREIYKEKGGQVFLVKWAGPDDPLMPRNWPMSIRIGIVLQISFLGLLLTAASAVDSVVIPQAAKELGVSEVFESLATGLFLVGMGIGSLIAGPFSETFGRTAVYSISLLLFMIWIMASALAPNIGSQITFRLLAGCCASAPLVCAGGTIADMFDRTEKTWTFPLFAIISFTGPSLGPVIAAFIGPSDVLSWRWAEWIMLSAGALVLGVVLLFMRETYAPTLLEWKATHYRNITGDNRFRAEHEITEMTLLSRLKQSMTRPFVMLTEPIIVVMTSYITVIYVVLFTFLVGWPQIFEFTYDISQGLSNTIFVAISLGTLSNFFLLPIIYRNTTHWARQHAHEPFKPEIRLWWGTYGASVAIPVSLFWLGWTNYSSISIWSAIFAVWLFGYGTAGIFICIYMYIIDSYETYSASALTFVALTRYVVAGGMTVVGIPFYENVGTHFTLTILGCIAAVLVPVPYVLSYRGHFLRHRSKYAVDQDLD